MNILFQQSAFNDYQQWAVEDKNVYRIIGSLIKEITRTPFLRLRRNDIQNKRAVFITSKPLESDFIKHEAASVTKNNLIEMAVYCAIRQVIEATWPNDRDNFQYPDSKWETNLEFQSDCLTNVIFDNDIRSAHGVTTGYL